tara:strand:- start:7246 stop:7452 length:207 start_codon:yes stop_codon:yes gene_type:complete
MSKIEQKVIDLINQRAKIGKKKYETTMDRNDLTFMEWMQHLQEEMLDASIYIEKLKSELIKEAKKNNW